MKATPMAGQNGFVLAVVLWSIAALTLITGGIMARINGTLEQAFQLRELAEQEQNIMATEQTLLYTLSAKHWNEAGVDLTPNPSPAMDTDLFARQERTESGPTLRFDGMAYRGIGNTSFAIQDAGATYSIMEPQRPEWLSTLASLGVEASDADQWLDQLNDYQDRDNLARLNGAEAEAYRELGLPEPPNRFMVSPHELRNLPIAVKYPAVTEVLIAMATTSIGTLANLNTSPPQILQLRHGLLAADAERVTENRSDHLITSVTQASSVYGVLFNGGLMASVWQPTGNVRIMLGDAQGRHTRWIAVKFTPNQNGRPWVIEYSHPVALPHRKQEPDQQDAFSPRFQTEAAPPATSWPSYPAFFPQQLSPD